MEDVPEPGEEQNKLDKVFGRRMANWAVRPENSAE